MQPEDGDAARLWDMLQEAQAIHALASRLDAETYMADQASRYLIDRRLEIIGGASKRISKSFKRLHPEIPWQGIAGLRNVLAHEYDEIDYGRVWEVVTTRIPDLIAMLEAVVPPSPPDPEPE